MARSTTHRPRRRTALEAMTLEPRRLLTAFHWAQDADGNFDDPNNWRDPLNNPGVPGPNDSADVAYGDITVTVRQPQEVARISAQSVVHIVGGVGLTVDNTVQSSQINALVLDAGATLTTKAGTTSIAGNATINGTIATVDPTAVVEFSAYPQGATANIGGTAALTGPGLFKVNSAFLTFALLADFNTPDRFELDGGTIQGPGDLTVTSTLDWTGGSFRGDTTATVPAGSTINIKGAGTKILADGFHLTIDGTANWTGAGGINANGVITNNGTFNVQNDATLNSVGGPVQFVNDGTFTKAGTGGTTTFGNVRFDSSGSITVASGTLLLGGGGIGSDAGNGGTFSGPVTVPAGSTLDFDNNFHILAIGAQLKGDGLYELTGQGTLRVEGAVTPTHFDMTAATLDVLGSFRVPGVFNWSGGTISGAGSTTVPAGGKVNVSGGARKALFNNAALTNEGTLTWTGTGEISGSPNTRIDNAGTMLIENDAAISNGGLGGGLTLNNTGTLTKQMSAGTTTISMNMLANTGTIHVDTGTLAVTTPYTNGGTLAVASGAAFDARGGYTQPADGTLRVAVAGTADSGGFGRVNVTGAAALGGTLEIDRAAGFVPDTGVVYPVLTYGSQTGKFVAITGQTIQPGLAFNVDVKATEFDLVVGPPVGRQVSADFDGDGKTDRATYTITNGVGTFSVTLSSDGTTKTVQLGGTGDFPVAGDYDGDGKTDYAVYGYSAADGFARFLVQRSSDGETVTQPFGGPFDFPVAGDYDGDGKTDYAVYGYSPDNGYSRYAVLLSSGAAPINQPFGGRQDFPVAGDYDGDGKTDVAVYGYSPDNGFSRFGILPSGGGSAYAVPFGGLQDAPLAGDFNGDGKTDVAVYGYSPDNGFSRFGILPSGGGSAYAVPFGGLQDYPVSGDYDGDGITDLAVYGYSPDNGFSRFGIIPSGGGPTEAIQAGSADSIGLPPFSGLFTIQSASETARLVALASLPGHASPARRASDSADQLAADRLGPA